MLYKLMLIALLLLILNACSLVTVRPLKKTVPQRMAEFPTTGIPLQQPAQISWNAYQVPFIKAATDYDCAFLLGMTHAHLRLGQMALFREIVNARAAKYAGPLAVNIDHLILAMDIGAAVPEIEINLPEATRFWLDAFTKGINHYQSRLTDLPVEMRSLKIPLRDWSVRDVLMMGRLISADVNWFNYFSLVKAQEEEHWKRYWQQILDLGTASTPSGKSYAQNPLEMLNHISRSGSNAFAVSDDKSATGAAIMASDPHLGLNLPNMWLLAGYECPSYHVVGLMFPALPAVLVGRNEDISFSGTNMRSASSDLVELTPAEVAKLETRKHKIEVRWWFDKTIILRRSEHGPVVSDAKFLKTKDKILALKWVGHQPSDEISAMLAMNQASDFEQFRAAFSTYAVSGQNFLYADKNGDVGLVPAVRIPIRNYTRPDAPSIPSNDASKAWQGYLNTSDLPYILRPESGFVASANNLPLSAPTPLGFFFSSNDRIERLNERLGSVEKVDMQMIKELHRDTYVASSLRVTRSMTTLLEKDATLNAEEKKLLAVLSNWDGYFRATDKAPVLQQLLLYHFINAYYPTKYDKAYAKRVLGSDAASDLVTADLDADPAAALPQLRAAWRKTFRSHGKYPTWGDMHRLNLGHFFARIPIIGGRYSFGDLPVGGSSNSLMKTAHSLSPKRNSANYGANARFIAFMDDDSRNLFVLMGAQDGWVGSEGFTDQVELWQKGEYMRIPLQWKDVRAEFPHHSVITP